MNRHGESGEGGAGRGERPDEELVPIEALTRRRFLQGMGASMALASGACARAPTEKILPYTVRPEDVVPGLPTHYATTLARQGYGVGVLVETHGGRPTKIEGNPDHPASLGATGPGEQAAVLQLYDPDRGRSIRERGAPRSLEAFVARFGAARADAGEGLRLVLGPTGSPLAGELLAEIQARFPRVRFTFYSPLTTGRAASGARLAFGRTLTTQLDLEHAEVIVALDCDVLNGMPGHLRHAREFARRRRPAHPGAPMNRLYVVEPELSVTGTMADHRLARRPSEIPALAGALAAELLALGLWPAGIAEAARAALAPLRGATRDRTWMEALARDLARRPSASVVVAGERQPPEVHALVHLMNAALGTRAAWLSEPVLLSPDGGTEDLAALAVELRAGAVDTLVILGENPSYSTPAELDFGALVRSVPTSLRVGLYEDETAADCVWFLPAAHDLEMWGDQRAFDGALSLMQPVLEPLYGGRSWYEVLGLLASGRLRGGERLLRESWSRREAAGRSMGSWEAAFRRGVLPGTRAAKVEAGLDAEGLAEAATRLLAARPSAGLELSLTPSLQVEDGRYGNVAWLQELPHPITKLTWDNAALLDRATAARLGVGDEDLVEIAAEGRRIVAPVLVAPGVAESVVSLTLGYGRRGAEGVARGVGHDVAPLRTAVAPWARGDVTVRKVAGRYPLARTQRVLGDLGRGIAVSATWERYARSPEAFLGYEGAAAPSLLPELPATGDQWAMAIDQAICTGCSACVVACQAENNVLVVGKTGVRRGREMHWLRIDTYFPDSRADVATVHQPMLCQHCERAPCEYVCPVNATVHSPDGLNEMVYNRCIGTRFCSNNCPYKVRRFNYFDWIEEQPLNRGPARLLRNPDVTVRERGVMEKCTFCVQRIRVTQIRARLEGRVVGVDEVRTACQEACPTEAIAFGSLANGGAEVSRRRAEPRSYAVLHELGTRPRVRYLAKIVNPNPEILEG